jgi:hypothetical protein
MTSTPPVPPANTSPFPIEEPPHAPTAPTASKSSSDEWAAPEKQGWSIGKIAGAAAGIGAIAIGVAAVLFPRDSAATPKKTKKRKS